MKIRWFVTRLCLVGIFLSALAGCNTIEGAGQDIENLGEEVEEEAD